jgi:hypothetical protein
VALCFQQRREGSQTEGLGVHELFARRKEKRRVDECDSHELFSLPSYPLKEQALCPFDILRIVMVGENGFGGLSIRTTPGS